MFSVDHLWLHVAANGDGPICMVWFAKGSANLVKFSVHLKVVVYLGMHKKLYNVPSLNNQRVSFTQLKVGSFWMVTVGQPFCLQCNNQMVCTFTPADILPAVGVVSSIQYIFKMPKLQRNWKPAFGPRIVVAYTPLYGLGHRPLIVFFNVSWKKTSFAAVLHLS